MTPAELLDVLFQSSPGATASDLRAFLKTIGPGTAPSASAFDRLVDVAAHANGRLQAGAAGHQAAIRRLFPDTPDDAITAFCVSEKDGPRPSKIFSALTPDGDGFRLSGTKRWGSMSPLADVLYVAASIGRQDGRNQLRMARVPTDAAGLALDTSGYADFAGHMPIADITLDQVAISAADVIEADAYDAYIKPFRLVEDVYSTASVQVGLLRLGRVHGWDEDVLEDLTGLIVQAHGISQTPMAQPQDVVLMAGYFRASGALWDRLGPAWALVPDAVRKAWSPDTGTLGVAARAREARRRNAWDALASS